jgi:hypothetical protein
MLTLGQRMSHDEALRIEALSAEEKTDEIDQLCAQAQLQDESHVRKLRAVLEEFYADPGAYMRVPTAKFALPGRVLPYEGDEYTRRDNRLIEIYWDPKGVYYGRRGCYRARLRGNHGIHDAGGSPEQALENFLRTAASLDRSSDIKDYLIQHLSN